MITPGLDLSTDARGTENCNSVPAGTKFQKLSKISVYQLNATRLNTTLNLTSLGSLLNWFGIQAIRVYIKLECQTPGYNHIVNWMHVIQWLF